MIVNVDQKLTSERLAKLQTAQDFYDFFAAIPAEKWCIDYTQNEAGQRCAWGHLGNYAGGHYGDVPVGGNEEALGRLASVLAPFNQGPYYSTGSVVFDINNGRDERYQQDNPRDRILAALKDAIEGKPSPEGKPPEEK